MRFDYYENMRSANASRSDATFGSTERRIPDGMRFFKGEHIFYRKIHPYGMKFASDLFFYQHFALTGQNVLATHNYSLSPISQQQKKET